MQPRFLPFRRAATRRSASLGALLHSSKALYLPKWVMTIPPRLWNFDFLFAYNAPGRAAAPVFCTCEWNTRWHRFYILLGKLPYPIPWLLLGFIWCDAGRIQRMAPAARTYRQAAYPPIDCKWKIVLLGTNRVRVCVCGGSAAHDPLLGAARNFILRCVALWIMPLLC